MIQKCDACFIANFLYYIVILFTMWTEFIKHFSENSKGNVIFLDGSTDGMKRTMQEMMSMNLLNTENKKAWCCFYLVFLEMRGLISYLKLLGLFICFQPFY